MSAPVLEAAPKERAYRKWLRLAAFLSALGLVAAVSAARQVHANVDDFLLGAGAQMMQLGESGGAPRTLQINGAKLLIRAQSVEGFTIEQVLDAFEERCKQRGTQLDAGVDKLLRKHHELDKSSRALFDGILRAETDSLGAIACLDTGGTAIAPEGLSARVGRFLRSLDVSDVGQLRYVRAEKSGSRVTLLMTWADGPLKLKEMFPREGDAPGVELGDLPRPPGGRRILSAWEEGQDPAVNSYLLTNIAPASVRTFYTRELAARGYQFLDPPHADGTPSAQTLFVWKQGRTAVIAITPRGNGALVTLAPDGLRGGVAMTPRP